MNKASARLFAVKREWREGEKMVYHMLLLAAQVLGLGIMRLGVKRSKTFESKKEKREDTYLYVCIERGSDPVMVQSFQHSFSDVVVPNCDRIAL